MSFSSDNFQAKVDRNNFRQGTLLVVEDNQDHWQLIRFGLQKMLPDVNLVWSATAPEALTYLTTCLEQDRDLPRLMLLDLYLPNRETGFHFLKSIKTATLVLRRIPVVILSGSLHPDDIKESYELGSSSYFVKPTGSDEWDAYFETIFNYWSRTVTLPNSRSR